MQAVRRRSKQKAGDAAGAASDGPSSPAGSLASMSGRSDAMSDDSSCDDMGASDSGASDSERQAKQKAVASKPRQGSGTRRRRLSSAKQPASSRKAADNSLLDDSDDEPGRGSGKSLPAASGRKSISRHAKLDSSGSDEEATPAADGPEKVLSPKLPSGRKVDAEKSSKQTSQGGRMQETGHDSDADLAASDSDAEPRRRRVKHQSSRQGLEGSDDDMDASPGKQAHQRAEGQGPPAEPVPVHDEAVDLFDSDSDGDFPAFDPASDDDAAAGAAKDAAEDPQTEVPTAEEPGPSGLTMSVEAVRGSASPAAAMLARDGRTSAMKPTNARDREDLRADQHMRKASPASTEKRSSGGGDVAGGDLEMADAETAGGLPSADHATSPQQSAEVSLDTSSDRHASGASPADAGSEHELSDGPEQAASPERTARSDASGLVSPADGPVTVTSDAAESSGLDSSRPADGGEKRTPTPIRQVSRKAVSSDVKTPAAAPAHDEPAAGGAAATPEDEDAAAGGEVATARKAATATEQGTSALQATPAADEPDASPPPRLTSKKTARKSMLGRLSMDMGKLWPFNRGSKAQAATCKPAAAGPEDAPARHDMEESAAAGMVAEQDAHEPGAESRPTTPRTASADDDDMPFSALVKKGATPPTGGMSTATPKGVEKRHGVSSSKRKGQRSSARLARKPSKPVEPSPVKGHLIKSNDEVSAGWKVLPATPIQKLCKQSGTAVSRRSNPALLGIHRGQYGLVGFSGRSADP